MSMSDVAVKKRWSFAKPYFLIASSVVFLTSTVLFAVFAFHSDFIQAFVRLLIFGMAGAALMLTGIVLIILNIRGKRNPTFNIIGLVLALLVIAEVFIEILAYGLVVFFLLVITLLSGYGGY